MGQTERAKAVMEGYVRCFEFDDGLLYSEGEARTGYQIKQSQIKPTYCPEMEEVVYRIQTIDGLKGYAVSTPNFHDD